MESGRGLRGVAERGLGWRTRRFFLVCALYARSQIRFTVYSPSHLNDLMKTLCIDLSDRSEIEEGGKRDRVRIRGSLSARRSKVYIAAEAQKMVRKDMRVNYSEEIRP